MRMTLVLAKCAKVEGVTHTSRALPKFESYRCSRKSPNFLAKMIVAYEQFHGIGRLEQ